MTRMLLLTAALLFLRPSNACSQQPGRPDDVAARTGSARVEPGDRVVVKVFREPLLGDTALVNGRGEIVLGRIGSVVAARLTIHELEDTLRARFGAFLRNPSVDVVVLRRVSVNGQVTRPDVYYVDAATRLRDVIARAGGITEVGSPSKVFIVRDGIRLSAPDWQESATAEYDLHSGDEVVVGMRSWLERNAIPVASTTLALASILITVIRR